MSVGRRFLLDRRNELLAAIRRGRVPAWARRAGLSDLVERTLEAWAGRAEAASRRAAERWVKNHELVRQALGVSPLDYRLDGLIAAVHSRLKGTLRPRAIREHLQALRHELGVTEPKRQRQHVTVVPDVINAKE